MKRSGDKALDQALAFHRAPGYLAAIRRLALPDDLQTLLRIAAGDSETTLDAAQRTGESPEALRDVTIFYLQQLLFADDGDSYRVLGVNPDASDEQIKLHYRWLARWLHPDRNPDEWETVFADRVNRAWQDLRTPDRRAAYDQNRPRNQHAVADPAVAFPDSESNAMREPPHTSRSLRWLPTLAMAGVGVFAVAALLLFRQSQVTEPESVADVTSPQATQTTQDGWIPAASSADTPRPARIAALPAVAPNAESRSEPAGPVASTGIGSALPESIPAASTPAESADPRQLVAAAPRVEPKPIMAPASESVAGNSLPVVKFASALSNPNFKPQSHPSSAAAEIDSTAPTAVSMPSRPGQVVATMSKPIPTPTPTPAPTHSPASPRAVGPPAATAHIETVALQSAPLPAPPVRPIPNENAAPNLIDDRIAASLASRFSQAYANGDTERLMQLFTQDAQNGHGDRRAIAEDYRRLFEASERRRIALSDLSWLAVGNVVTIIGSFETEVVPRGKTHGEHVSGDIRFDLREENGELRIYRLSHDNRRS